MRIAIVSNFYPPIQTGSCYWAQNLAQAYRRAGDEVVVVTVGRNRVLEREEDEGVPVYRLPSVFNLPKAGIFMNFDSFLLMNSRANRRALAEILREHGTEVVHHSNHLLDSVFMVERLCRELGLPWINTIHGAIRHSGNRFYSALMQAVDRLYIRRTMDRADALVALDQELERYGRETYRARRLLTIPLCSMTRDFLEAMPQASPGGEGPGGVLRVASIGHMTENRDRTDLVAAARLLRERGVKVHFEVIGRRLVRTAERLAEQQGVADCFTFHGELPRQEMLDLLANVQAEAHLFFMPGLGNATLEAMAAGLPAICYGYDGIYGDVPLQDGGNIFFADLERPETIADALERLAGDPDLRARAGLAARRLVATHLTWDVVIERYRALFAELLAARAPGAQA